MVGRLVDEHGFSGVVRVDRDGVTEHASAHGLAERAFEVPNTLDTQFGVASIAKSLTAMTVVSLVADGLVGLGARVRDLLGDELPDIAPDVTVEHLLAHRSGIGDYLDESVDWQPTDYVLAVAPHRLERTEDYLAVLGGHSQAFPPGTEFAYCNGGFVVLALLAERASGMPFHALVHARVCEPAGMADTAFDRGDEPGPRTALGYLEPDGLRTNVLHLPVQGSGDGGIVTTAADVRAFWTALFAGRLLGAATVALLATAPEGDPYGLGFWLDPPGLALEGSDAGVSCRTLHDPERDVTVTVLANTSEGAWPIAGRLAESAPWAPAGAEPKA